MEGIFDLRRQRYEGNWNMQIGHKIYDAQND
jgi:hypothetical protein